MLDYIIVGCGLAGISFAELALENKKSIVVFENASQPSSTVAGGMYNPVVLKRFTAIWKAAEQIELADSFYPKLEQKLNAKFNYPMPLWRKFSSIEEQNNWFTAADKPKLSSYLQNKLQNETIYGIDSPFGFGEVSDSGYLDIKCLLEAYQNYLENSSLLIKETFDYNELSIDDATNYVTYKNLRAKHIIFAEGFGLHQNPFFNFLPLDGTKGELLHIKSKGLRLDKIVKSNVFILPIGNDTFKVGATYNWEDKTNEPTAEGKAELLEKLDELLSCDYEVIEHLAGVRPTVNDRRPLVGAHPKHKQFFVLNGLGTRGVLLGPFLAKSLWDTIENDIPLDPEVDCKRYFSKS